MSQPGYLASFEQDSIAQEIAIQVDADVDAAGSSLRAPEIKIPLDTLLDEQARFEGLSAQGHRGTPALYMAHTESELADRDAQMNYDLFRDASLPAMAASRRFAAIDGAVDFHLSDQALAAMTENSMKTDQQGKTTVEASPLQTAGVNKGASVSEASAAVTLARREVRVAHAGIKLNLLELKEDLFEQQRDDAQEKADDYEQKIARVGKVLDCVGMVFGATSAAGSVVGALGDASTMDKVGAAADVGGVGSSVVKFGADLFMGGRLAALKTEIASHQAFIAGIAGIQERVTLDKNFDAFQLALDTYAEACGKLETATEARRQQYAEAGMLADARLAGTPDEGGNASQAMLLGSAAEETQVFLDAALVEHGVAKASVDTARDRADDRAGAWWYRDAGSFFGPTIEFAKQNFRGGPDVTALTKMASVLSSWKTHADQAKAYLDEVTAGFEASVLHPAGAGGGDGDKDVY